MCAMKINITLKLDTSLLREAKILAAEQDSSISALVAEKLEGLVRERKSYDRARRRALSRLRVGFSLNWKAPRSREELHER
jgi:CRISPR/Cas system-associated protein Csm6